MGEFAALIHNENIKIFRRLRTWIMLFILALISALFPALIHFTSNGNDVTGIWDSFQTTMAIAFFLNTIFTALVAADSVAGEFTWGTIKLLLIRPWSRSKILLSKYLSMVIFSLISTAVLIGFGYGSALIFSSSAVEPLGGNVMSWSQGEYVFLLILCSYIELFLTAAIAFMISSVFRSSGLAIVLSLSIMFTKDIFIAIFSPERYEWANYLIFAHMNLSNYLLTDTGPGGATLGFAIAVLAVYYVILMAVSWIVFRKRDVAA
ncbi:ABC transporter permease subunit [Paenibacillus tritici]|uniref:ABC transporter permease subunit n=1 Tax=Paenibacillus tritici TaxID=1873425 RepID=A0ABX2DSK7_9BACL|nr:ABC transporter permease subunit [Paenibacillus tritici]NQX47395.1 ABC transporter permease subunit [Paenibacillus tritici]QUL55936.1 ABC transporter permease subunit [Paenibacillus tritici]